MAFSGAKEEGEGGGGGAGEGGGVTGELDYCCHID